MARPEGACPAMLALPRAAWLPRAALACAIVLAMAACFDGYPQAQEPLLSPYDMTQVQRLAQLNALGAQAHPDRRWSYALMPGCVLRVDMDGPLGPTPSRDIALLGQTVVLGADREQGIYQVQLQPANEPDAQAVQVISGEKWTDASWTQLLLRLLQKGCLDRADR